MDLLSLVQKVRIEAELLSLGNETARSSLLQTIHKLTLAAETPTQTLMRISYQPVQNASIRIAVEMGLPNAIVAGKGEAVTAAELASKSGADVRLVARIMRVLVALAVVDEVGGELYKPNALTEELASASWTSGIRYLYDSIVPTTANIIKFLHSTGFQNPTSKSPFEYAIGENLWSWVRSDSQRQTDMMAYMAGRRKRGIRWTEVFDPKSLLPTSRTEKEHVLLVDVGGNQGHDLKLFQACRGDLPGRLVLLDLPEAVKKLEKLDGIEVMAYDFFTPQLIKGAQVYFFRAICHDWSDAKCQQFLGNTVKAMEKGYSKLLINDFVLPDTDVPLHPALMDVMMMSLCSGIERSERQWRELIDSVGLQVVKIWRTEGIEAVIETMLKE
ncbi:S-adenosyl-L-methionine-dependent methyltransferase [Stipitochalara longipes BDJ]|nr:S-adenosyl-L-methionine-dependent methyltransferase [Stipitochalara longipes BDJ]